MTLKTKLVGIYFAVMVVVGLAATLLAERFSRQRNTELANRWRSESQQQVIQLLGQGVNSLRRANLLMAERLGNDETLLSSIDDLNVDEQTLPKPESKQLLQVNGIQPQFAQRFVELSSAYLDTLPWVDVIGIGTPNGSCVTVDKSAMDQDELGNSFFQHLSWCSRNTQGQMKFATIMSRSIAKDQEIKDFKIVPFDSRDRVWYQSARKASAGTWTDVYRFENYDDKTISFTQPLAYNDNHEPWVLYYCISHRRLRDQLAELANDDYVITVLDSKGQQIVSSDDAASRDVDLKLFDATATNIRYISSGGVRRLAYSFPLKKQSDTLPPWLIILDVREDHFAEEVSDVYWKGFFMWLGVLAFGFVIVTIVSRPITRAMEVAVEAQVERAAALEERDRSQQEMINAVNHEVLAPLLPVSLFLENLWSSTMLPQQWNNRIGIARYSVAHVQNLARTFLMSSRIERGHKIDPVLAAVDISLLVKNTVEMVRCTIEKGVTLDLICSDGKCVVLTDEQLLRQILLNLLSNSAKFTKVGTISVELDWQLDETRVSLIFRVTDTASPISAEAVVKLFQPFERGTRAVPGFGIGLAISQNLAHALGGNLVYEEQQSGNRFVLQFSALKGTLPENQLNSSSLRGMVACIVDDNEGMRVELCGYLQLLGCETRSYSHWTEMLADLDSRSTEPDIVVMDYHLGFGDSDNGLVGASKLRERSDSLALIPIVLMSGDVLKSSQNDLTAVNKCLHKSSSPSHIVKVIEDTLLCRAVDSFEMPVPVIQPSSREELVDWDFVRLEYKDDIVKQFKACKIVLDALNDGRLIELTQAVAGREYRKVIFHSHDLKMWLRKSGALATANMAAELQVAATAMDAERMSDTLNLLLLQIAAVQSEIERSLQQWNLHG